MESFETSPKKLFGSQKPPPPPAQKRTVFDVKEKPKGQPTRLQRVKLLAGGHTTVELTPSTTAANVCDTVATRRHNINTQLALLVEAAGGARRLADEDILWEVTRRNSLHHGSESDPTRPTGV